MHGDAVLLAGGAYPSENFSRHVSTSLSDAIDVTVDVDLGLTPERYRDEVVGLIQRVR